MIDPFSAIQAVRLGGHLLDLVKGKPANQEPAKPFAVTMAEQMQAQQAAAAQSLRVSGVERTQSLARQLVQDPQINALGGTGQDPLTLTLQADGRASVRGPGGELAIPASQAHVVSQLRQAIADAQGFQRLNGPVSLQVQAAGGVTILG